MHQDLSDSAQQVTLFDWSHYFAVINQSSGWMRGKVEAKRLISFPGKWTETSYLNNFTPSLKFLLICKIYENKNLTLKIPICCGEAEAHTQWITGAGRMRPSRLRGVHVFVYVSVTCRIPAESKDVAIKAPHIMHCSVCVPVRIHIKTHTLGWCQDSEAGVRPEKLIKYNSCEHATHTHTTMSQNITDFLFTATHVGTQSITELV